MGTEIATSVEYSDALKAYEMRRQGKSLVHILRETSFEDGVSAMLAIKSIEQETQILARQDRDSALDTALGRLDDAIAAAYDVMTGEYWKYDKDGTAVEPDPKPKLDAAKTLVQAVKAQAELQGLTKIDPTDKTEMVVLVQGEQGDYIQVLQELVEGD